MTALAIGDRVRILSCFYPGATGTVIEIDNGMPTMTVTVMLDATQHRDAYDTYFAPSELEIIHDDAATVRPEPLPDAGERQGIPVGVHGQGR